MNYKLLIGALFLSISCFSQSALSIQLTGQYNYPVGINDVWGYADTAGNEYALVGLDTAFSILDISDPANPVEVVGITGVHTTWRDIKTWDHYAYVTHDSPWSINTFPSEGLMIVDLDSLQTPRFKRINFVVNVPGIVNDTLERAHNLYIDENGICYLFGSNIGWGGALMFDLAPDPWNPTFVGIFNDHYLHDGMVRGDTLWGGAIYAGMVLAVDVSDKSTPVIMGQKGTPNAFTHNCWISDDGKTVFTTDELPDSYVAAYDVTDLNNITEIDRIQRLPDSNLVPHNVHVFGDFLVTSYYTSGVQIVDAEYPNNLVEVGYYDTYFPNDGPTYNGNWGAYPYLPSGNLLVTDRTYGLQILNAEYKRASRISGNVKDSLTQQKLFLVDMITMKQQDTIQSGLDGSYIYGIAQSGWDTLNINHPGYYPQKVPFQMVNGVNKVINITLIPLTIGLDENKVDVPVVYPNPAKSVYRLNWSSNDFGKQAELQLISLDGQIVDQQKFTIVNSKIFSTPNKAGMYLLKLIVSGNHLPTQKLIIE